MLRSIRCCVSCNDVLRPLPPDLGVSISLSESESLFVSSVVQVETEKTSKEAESGVSNAEIVGMLDQVETNKSIECRNPDRDSPVDIEPESIVHDVDGIEVSMLPQEELSNIESLKSD